MMAFDLESLRLIYWAMLGVLVVGLAVCEGLTMGVTLLVPLLANTDRDRQYLLSLIAPSSLANLAWLCALAAFLFAAWPIAYAVSVASLYPILLLMLLAVLLRPLVLYFVDAFDNAQCREYGHKVLFASGLLPAALFGLLAGNLLKGIPFHLDSDMHIRFLGDFGGFFNLFAIVVAVTCLALLAMHGSAFIQLKTNGELRTQAKAMTVRAGVMFLIFFVLAGLWIMHLEGYHVTSEILPNDHANPLMKFVKRAEGLWLDNYEHLPVLWLVPALAFIGGIVVLVLAQSDKAYWAMLASSLCVSMVVLTFGVSMFPFLLPSNISLNSSLTIWDSSASRLSLQVLLWVVVFALPLMAVLSRWVQRLFASQADGVDLSER